MSHLQKVGGPPLIRAFLGPPPSLAQYPAMKSLRNSSKSRSLFVRTQARTSTTVPPHRQPTPDPANMASIVKHAIYRRILTGTVEPNVAHEASTSVQLLRTRLAFPTSRLILGTLIIDPPRCESGRLTIETIESYTCTIAHQIQHLNVLPHLQPTSRDRRGSLMANHAWHQCQPTHTRKSHQVAFAETAFRFRTVEYAVSKP